MADKKIKSPNGSPKPCTGPTRPGNLNSASGSGGDAKINSANNSPKPATGKAFTGFAGRTQAGLTNANGHKASAKIPKVGEGGGKA